MSAVRTIRAAAPHLMESKGAIVNVSSLNGKIPAVEAPDYSAMKSALLSLSRALALEFATSQVRVNAVTPGPVLTDFQIGPDGIAEQLTAAGAIASSDDYLEMVAGNVPAGRFAKPNEVADLILVLLSPRLDYVTGADYAIDGALQIG